MSVAFVVFFYVLLILLQINVYESDTWLAVVLGLFLSDQ